MTIYVGMKYLDYAADTMYGKNFCDLPEPIKDAIEEYFDGMNLDENPDSNPDNMWVNSFIYCGDRVLLCHSTELTQFGSLMDMRWMKKKLGNMTRKN